MNRLVQMLRMQMLQMLAYFCILVLDSLQIFLFDLILLLELSFFLQKGVDLIMTDIISRLLGGFVTRIQIGRR